MKYDYLTIIMEELKTTHKLHSKLIGQHCFELTPEQGKLLYLIKNKKMSQKELAKELHITEATLSVRIKRLLDAGLIERETDENDKRIMTIVLSEHGKNVTDDIEKKIMQYQVMMFQGITVEEYETVMNVIRKIQENIKEEIK